MKNYQTYVQPVVFSVSIIFLTCTGCDDASQAGKPTATEALDQSAQAPMEAQKARVGVGVQGSRIRADDSMASDLVTGPAKVLFNTKEKVVFEIQLPQALQLFKALEGRSPTSHDEYMTTIVRANRIALPKLPEGMQYVYHVDEEELWVEPIAQ